MLFGPGFNTDIPYYTLQILNFFFVCFLFVFNKLKVSGNYVKQVFFFFLDSIYLLHVSMSCFGNFHNASAFKIVITFDMVMICDK